MKRSCSCVNWFLKTMNKIAATCIWRHRKKLCQLILVDHEKDCRNVQASREEAVSTDSCRPWARKIATINNVDMTLWKETLSTWLCRPSEREREIALHTVVKIMTFMSTWFCPPPPPPPFRDCSAHRYDVTVMSTSPWYNLSDFVDSAPNSSSENLLQRCYMTLWKSHVSNVNLLIHRHSKTEMAASFQENKSNFLVGRSFLTSCVFWFVIHIQVTTTMWMT